MKEKEEKKLKLTGKITPAVIIRPTSSLRINMCSGRGGTLEQLWIDEVNNKEYWKPVPRVYPNTTTPEPRSDS